MTRVAIGVHVHAEPRRLRATLAAIRANTATPYELLVIPDGADGETADVLAALEGARMLEDEGARGGAAALNRLARSTDAEVLVLVESGLLVAPGWLGHLLRGLAAPRAGLAGPSTNRSWNEQGVFPEAAESDGELARVAAEAEKRFGLSMRTLAPLYSLADFCYAISREAFDAAGGADERYGLGPCWEMDLNVRAARAGFDGLWVGAAYVWRAPFTERRAREETQRFEASKRLYQDKFCGARLRGKRRGYRAACRGDACPNFAPLAKIAPPPRAAPPIVPTDPLVSCIMPTYDRRAFVPQAIRCFLAQDYPHRELIVVDDGTDPVRDLLPDDPRIVYVRLTHKMTVGAKRNLACERARGGIIVHWDDDDWYPSSRISMQVRALVEQGTDVCGTSTLYYREHRRAFCYRYGASRASSHWVAGNTLAYRREAWAEKHFPEVQVGEDSQFVWRFGAGRVSDLRDPALCVAAIHSANVSPKHPRGSFWVPESYDRVLGVIAQEESRPQVADPPLVTCIMPTCDRRPFIPLALARFQEQTYARRELVVIDDGSDPVEDLLRDVPGVRYVRLPRRATIGAKRNMAVEESRGEVIIHWDDDDWYSPDRLAMQVDPILRDDADITGLVARHFLQADQLRFWTVTPELHAAMFVCDVSGGTLAYRRGIWGNGLRYPSINLAEDAWFVRNAVRRRHRLVRVDGEGAYVYVRHGAAAWHFPSGSFLNRSGWSETAAPSGFPEECLRAYADAARSCGGALPS